MSFYHQHANSSCHYGQEIVVCHKEHLADLYKGAEYA
jgi:hypothetical protein